MRIPTLLVSLLSLLMAGCASYQLGNTGSLPYASVHVAPPLNQTSLPNIEGAINAALRQSIIQSGTLKLEEPGQSDAVLKLTLLESKRSIAAVTPDDVGRGRKFELNIDLSLTLEDPSNPARPFLAERRFSITQDIFTDSGLVDAEHQAAPEISRKIARKVTELMLDAW